MNPVILEAAPRSEVRRMASGCIIAPLMNVEMIPWARLTADEEEAAEG
jgi:hypothetical protein